MRDASSYPAHGSQSFGHQRFSAQAGIGNGRPQLVANGIQKPQIFLLEKVGRMRHETQCADDLILETEWNLG